jgi:NAD(P)-dependent dehydrogenase (short-subunit alcohol dehydrogenase family)
MTGIPRTPSFRLDGKSALVTGAGRGLGLAAAAALAQAGAEVTLVARTKSEIEAGRDAIVAAGGVAHAVPLDVTDLPAMQACIAGLPALDILVNNAGTNRPAPFLEVVASDFDHVMGINVRAAFFVAQAVARKMTEERRAGSIINISSQMGLVGGPRRSVYCASKWAVEGFTKAAAIELGPLGVRVNTICPTFIETPMTRPFFGDSAFLTSVLKNIKLGRLGQLEDIMGAIVFLASDASSLMTGSALVLDGGWTAD